MENWFQLADSIESRWSYYDEDAGFDMDFYTPMQLNLSGTPLDHSLVLMRDYLKDFKSNHNLDIVSLITLTDGSSHGCMTGNAHIVDRQINRVFKMSNRNSYRATHQLLGWIQETVGVRTIGFYITQCKGTSIIWEGQNFCGTQVDPYGEDYDKHST